MEVNAFEWFGGWQFLALWRDSRTMGMPEFRIFQNISPVELLARVYRTTKDAFTGLPLPPELEVGKAQDEYERKTRAVIPPPPTVWAEREFFRFCLSYIEKPNDLLERDYEIKLAATDGQLRIASGPHTIYCPARGSWLGSSTISARELFQILPKRFSRDAVSLEQHGNKLKVEGRYIKAVWHDT